MPVKLPSRPRGRTSQEARALWDEECGAFAEWMIDTDASLGFRISTRGWCYMLENAGAIAKDQFAAATIHISRARKHRGTIPESGWLPIDICSEDETRTASHVEYLDDDNPEAKAQHIVEEIDSAHLDYDPISFWQGQDYYVEMLVEKIDLKSLFDPICRQYHVPLTNQKGWGDINSRANIIARLVEHEREGRRPVLLLCGDHDPVGLQISSEAKAQIRDVARAFDWDAEDLIVERFGLNADFINRHRLSWIENLETSSGGDLSDPRHKHHNQPHVQSYLKKFKARKCEANALVVNPQAAEQLCRAAINRYVPESAIATHRRRRQREQAKVRSALIGLLRDKTW